MHLIYLGPCCCTASRSSPRRYLCARPLFHGVGGAVLGRTQAGLQLCPDTLYHHQVFQYFLYPTSSGFSTLLSRQISITPSAGVFISMHTCYHIFFMITFSFECRCEVFSNYIVINIFLLQK